MSSSSATSQNQNQNHNNSESESVDIRKRKRMQSNRESARRSRQRKQKQLDDLTAEVTRLLAQNGQILSTTNVTTQLYVRLDAENSVLKAQLAELNNRLNSLNDIVRCLTSPSMTMAMAVKSRGGETTSFESDEGSFELDNVEDCFSVESFGEEWPAFSTGMIMPAENDVFMC